MEGSAVAQRVAISWHEKALVYARLMVEASAVPMRVAISRHEKGTGCASGMGEASAAPSTGAARLWSGQGFVERMVEGSDAPTRGA